MLSANEPCCSARESLFGQVYSSLLTDSRLLPQRWRSSAAEGDRASKRPAQDNGVPAPLHACIVRDGGQGGQESLPNPHSSSKEQALPAWVRRSRSTVAVFNSSFGQLETGG